MITELIRYRSLISRKELLLTLAQMAMRVLILYAYFVLLAIAIASAGLFLLQAIAPHDLDCVVTGPYQLYCMQVRT